MPGVNSCLGAPIHGWKRLVVWSGMGIWSPGKPEIWKASPALHLSLVSLLGAKTKSAKLLVLKHSFGRTISHVPHLLIINSNFMLVYDLIIWIFITHCGLLSLPCVSSVAGIPQQTDGDPWPSRALFCQVHPIQRREGKWHPEKARTC